MTKNQVMELCIAAFFQFVLGPAVQAWIAAKASAKPKRKRKTHRKTTR
jgi:hypothetical protein